MKFCNFITFTVISSANYMSYLFDSLFYRFVFSLKLYLNITRLFKTIYTNICYKIFLFKYTTLLLTSLSMKVLFNDLANL